MEKMADSTALKPVRCGCGGEAEVDYLLQPDGFYMAGCYCKKCGTKTIPFWDKEKDKAIDYAVTTWNKAMGERTAKVIDRRYNGTVLGILADSSYGICENCWGDVSDRYTYCPHCGARLEWK